MDELLFEEFLAQLMERQPPTPENPIQQLFEILRFASFGAEGLSPRERALFPEARPFGAGGEEQEFAIGSDVARQQFGNLAQLFAGSRPGMLDLQDQRADATRVAEKRFLDRLVTENFFDQLAATRQ